MPQIDEHLCRLKSNGVATSSSSSITEELNGLRDLYELVDSWLQLPSTQNSLAQSCNDNELLNGSLRLLDVCGLAKDALLQAKEDTQQLQSVFRKRRGDDAGFANEAKAYLASRKRANKFINKSLRDLKIRKCDAHNDVEATFTILKDVEGYFRSIGIAFSPYNRVGSRTKIDQLVLGVEVDALEAHNLRGTSIREQRVRESECNVVQSHRF
ncbi:hypothetical protein V6N13_149622 [Hibiscus sabdariffa]|uniref:Uncharacterized protein n=1 Tax=Hibiscus sabdariffa TaxID=183260 RepID=A0ABR2EGV6_9ROSI